MTHACPALRLLGLNIAVVPFVELFVDVIVPELGFGVRPALGNIFVVKLALDLAVEDLQVLVLHNREVLGEGILRREMQLFRHGDLSGRAVGEPVKRRPGHLQNMPPGGVGVVHHPRRRRSCANATNWSLVRSPSLSNTLRKWVLTVASEIKRLPAISEFPRPFDASRKTSPFPGGEHLQNGEIRAGAGERPGGMLEEIMD